MKQITILLATIFLFVGCGNYLTEVWINEDTSGQTKISIDAGDMIGMIGMAMQEMGGNEDETTAKMNDNDSFFGEGKIDSTIVMYDMAPDSVKQMMTKPELLKNMIMEMKGDADKKEMIVSMSIQYENPDELAEFFSQLSVFQDGAQGGGAMSQDDLKKMFDSQKVDYKNGIVRITRQNMLEDLKKEGLFDQDMKMQLDSLRMIMDELGQLEDSEDADLNELAFLKQMLDADLKSVYYLPGEIQFTNDRDAVINGHTVTFFDNLWEALLNDDNLDISDRIIKYSVK